MEKIKEKIKKAYNTLFKNDGYLFSVDANERSLTHKLAVYLQNEFPEYNRNGIHKKKLISFKKNITSDDTEGTTVYPNIIIHHRGTEDNFIVIEAKKSTNKENDDEKLLAYKNDLNYPYAYAIIFPVGENLSTYNKDHIDSLIIEK